MPIHNRPRYRRILRRRVYVSKNKLCGYMIMGLALIFMIGALHVGSVLRELSGQMALSDAKDTAIDTVNEAMLLMMSRGNYDYDYFVDLGVSVDGQVTSLNANMSRINAFSAA